MYYSRKFHITGMAIGYGFAIITTLLVLVGYLANPSFRNIPIAQAAVDIPLQANHNDHKTFLPLAAKQQEEKRGQKEVAEDNGNCDVNQRYPQKILQWCDIITKYSQKQDLDPNLVAALIWQESGGDPIAYSKSGAVGLMQVMPNDGLAAYFMCKNGPCFTNRPSIEELQNPAFNVEYGTRMLRGLQNKYGNVRDALMYYGPLDVGYYYADKVLGIYQNHK